MQQQKNNEATEQSSTAADSTKNFQFQTTQE